MGGQPIAGLENDELAICATESDRVVTPHLVAIADSLAPFAPHNSRRLSPRVRGGVPPWRTLYEKWAQGW